MRLNSAVTWKEKTVLKDARAMAESALEGGG